MAPTFQINNQVNHSSSSCFQTFCHYDTQKKDILWLNYIHHLFKTLDNFSFLMKNWHKELDVHILHLFLSSLVRASDFLGEALIICDTHFWSVKASFLNPSL